MFRILLVTGLIFINVQSFSQEILLSKPCDLGILKDVQEALSNRKKVNLSKFFSTFDKACSDNVEFSEWYNSLLFELLDYNPENFITSLADESKQKIEIIVEEFNVPVTENTFENLIDKIKGIDFIKHSKQEAIAKKIIAALANS